MRSRSRIRSRSRSESTVFLPNPARAIKDNVHQTTTIRRVCPSHLSFYFSQSMPITKITYRFTSASLRLTGQYGQLVCRVMLCC